MNYVTLVGRLVKNIEKKGNKYFFTIAIQRGYKNMYGEYETDFVDVVSFAYTSQNVFEYCIKGDILGIRGRIETEIIENEDKRTKITRVVADKIMLISCVKKESEEQ